MITQSEPKRYEVKYQGRHYCAYLYPDGRVEEVKSLGRNGLRTIYRGGGTRYGKVTLAVIERACGHARLESAGRPA